MKGIAKKTKVEYIRHKLSTSKNWAIKGLMTIYSRQSNDEKSGGFTTHNNNIGFTSIDANFMSSLASNFQKYNNLTDKQMQFVYKKIPKYWKQILKLSDDTKLIACMLRDGWVTLEQVEEQKQKEFVGLL